MWIEITLNGICPTLNQMYAGQHWYLRKKLADEWHRKVKEYCEDNKLKPIKKFPIDIISQTKFKTKRGRDTSNCFYASKLVEDGLVKCGILPDDSTEYVRHHIIIEPIINNGINETKIVLTDENALKSLQNRF